MPKSVKIGNNDFTIRESDLKFIGFYYRVSNNFHQNIHSFLSAHFYKNTY